MPTLARNGPLIMSGSDDKGTTINIRDCGCLEEYPYDKKTAQEQINKIIDNYDYLNDDYIRPLRIGFAHNHYCCAYDILFPGTKYHDKFSKDNPFLVGEIIFVCYFSGKTITREDFFNSLTFFPK